jgi:hypothetical protein
MATPDRIRTHQVTESLPPNIAPIQAGETQNLPRLRRDVYSTRNAPSSYPRIPRLVSKNAKSTTSTLGSQFQVNAGHVQKPLSLISRVSFFIHQTFLPLSSLHARTKMQKRAVQCQPPYDAVRCIRMKSKCPNVNFPTSGHFFLTRRRPGGRRRCFRRPVLSNTSLAGAIPPLRQTRDRALAGGVVGPRHQRIVTTSILSTLTTSFLHLLPRGEFMMTAPAARSPLPFFAGRQSYPLTPTQSPHRTDSAFYASVHPK